MNDILIYALIFVFLALIVPELYRRLFFYSYKEGMEDSSSTSASNTSYQNYDPNLEVTVNKNSANIDFLKGQVDSLNQTSTGLNTTVTNLSSQVKTLQDQVQGLTTAQQAYAQPEVANAEPGIDEDEEEEQTPLVQQEDLST
jgi:hypothetical protein